MASSSNSPSPSGTITGGQFQPSSLSGFVSTTLIDYQFTVRSFALACPLVLSPLVPALMLFSPHQHVVVRRGLVLVIIRLHVILAHRVVLESIPHQNAAQVTMAAKNNPIKIEDLALLELCRAPYRRERRQLHLIAAVHSLHANHQRPMFFRNRIEMVDNLKT